MKKIGLLSMGLAVLALAGCNCNCNKSTNEDEALNKATQYCIDNGGTHSLIHSQTAVYGECSFPSGVICEDTILGTDECDFSPNLGEIDTEEKRLTGCEENAQGWMNDFIQGAENVSIQWGEESEGGASFVRNGVITYTKDGNDLKMNVECIADFVDGSIGVTYYDNTTE